MQQTRIAAISSLAMIAGMAQADTTTFDNVSGNNWNTAANWDNGVPGATDRAVIPAGESCEIDIDAVADTMDVAGTLIINDDKSLTLSNTTDNESPTGADHSQVDGDVQIHDNSTLAFVDGDQGITGDGNIAGYESTSKVTIEADIKITNRLAATDQGFLGDLIIQGLTGGTDNGTFRNDGNVIADIFEQRILLHEDTILEDHSTTDAALWQAGAGKLEFDRAAPTLKGQFVVVCGILDIDASVRTCGTFVFNAGLITIESGDVFAYGDFSTNSSCTPGTVTPTVRDCTVYELNSSSSNLTCGNCWP